MGKYCTKCKNLVDSNALFCVFCGNSLKIEEIDALSFLPKQYKTLLGGMIEFGVDQIKDLKKGKSWGYDKIYNINAKFNTGWRKDIGSLDFNIKETDSAKILYTIHFSMDDYEEMNALINYIKEKHENYLSQKNEEMLKEHRKKCNVCGNIFCYNGYDVQRNQNNEKDAAFATMVAGLNAISGTRYDMYEQSKRSESLKNQVIDYGKCPNCGSRDLVELEESTHSDDNSEKSIDEIRKYKKLLDEGIITQEEFDKKKKELLGL